jgi:hypothetical protein
MNSCVGGSAAESADTFDAFAKESPTARRLLADTYDRLKRAVLQGGHDQCRFNTLPMRLYVKSCLVLTIHVLARWLQCALVT